VAGHKGCRPRSWKRHTRCSQERESGAVKSTNRRSSSRGRAAPTSPNDAHAEHSSGSQTQWDPQQRMDNAMEERHSSPATPDQWALRWLKALPGGDSNVRAAFTCWVRHSARYVEAYCRQKMLDTELRGLDPERRIDVAELVRRARGRIRAQGTVVPWPLEIGPGNRPPDSMFALATRAPRSWS
jgi:hypothetical protein